MFLVYVLPRVVNKVYTAYGAASSHKMVSKLLTNDVTAHAYMNSTHAYMNSFKYLTLSTALVNHFNGLSSHLL